MEKLQVTDKYDIQEREAVKLHQQILTNGELAAAALVEFCKGLKKMRDEKLYTKLGYESFEEYAEKAVGIGQRQAYTYISSFEKLGEDTLQATARLGITKIELLASVPAYNRDQLMEEVDLEGMSTREIKEILEKYNDQGKQLTLLQEEKSTAEETAKKTEAEMAEIMRELEELRSRPVEVAVQQPGKDELNKIKKEAEKAAIEKAAKEHEKAVQKIRETAEKRIEQIQKEAAGEAEKKMQASLTAIEKEKAEALQRAQELEKKLSITGNQDTVLFSLIFEELQANVNKLLACIQKMENTDKEAAGKFGGALKKYLGIIDGKI